MLANRRQAELDAVVGVVTKAGGRAAAIAATGGMAGLSAYPAGTGALGAMIRAVALEVGPDGIRTPMTSIPPEAALAPIASHAVPKPVGEPEDVGDVARWLCTDEARFVTGQSILADGGFNIGGARRVTDAG